MPWSWIVPTAVSLGTSLFGGKKTPQYQPPQTPDWLTNAYGQAWQEISAPASYGATPQSYIDRGMSDIEKAYSQYVMGDTYGYNTKNLMDSGIYSNYLSQMGEHQAGTIGDYMSNIAHQDAMMKNQAEQARLGNMASFLGQVGGTYGTPYQTSLDQYNAAMQSQQAASQRSGMLGAGLGSMWGDYMGSRPQKNTQQTSPWSTSYESNPSGQNYGALTSMKMTQ